MRFRLGLIIGLLIGYTLGAKAGRQRYEQIQSLWGSVRRSDPAQQIGTEVSHAATRAGRRLEEQASKGVHKVTDLVRGDAPDARVGPGY
jgi:hypothetical protein